MRSVGYGTRWVGDGWWVVGGGWVCMSVCACAPRASYINIRRYVPNTGRDIVVYVVMNQSRPQPLSSHVRKKGGGEERKGSGDKAWPSADHGMREVLICGLAKWVLS